MKTIITITCLILILSPVLIIKGQSPNISPEDIDIVWSADTYVPAWYEGKPLPTIGSEITVSAIIPSSKKSSNFEYIWLLDNQLISGERPDEISFTAQRYVHNIAFKLSNKNGVFLTKYLEIRIVEPQTILYELINSSPSTTSKNNYYVSPGNVIDLMATPYFFGINNINDLEFEWYLEGEDPITTSSNNANYLKLTIDKGSRSNIEKTLTVTAKRKVDLIQQSSAQIILKILKEGWNL